MNDNSNNANSVSDLIEMAANNAIQEDAANNGGIEVVKNVNLDFGSMRLNDKKRMRGSGSSIFGS